MQKKSFLYGRCEGNRAFTLLESLLGGSLALLSTILVFSALLNYLSVCERVLARIELTETAVTAEYALFQFSRYGSSVESLAGGKKVRLRFTQNSVEVYPTDKTLVVLNRGVANPLAEGCGEETAFAVERSLRGRALLKVYLPFDFGGKNETLSLAIGVQFWKK